MTPVNIVPEVRPEAAGREHGDGVGGIPGDRRGHQAPVPARGARHRGAPGRAGLGPGAARPL